MKTQLLVSTILVLGLSGSVFGKSPGVLELHYGENKIPIVVHNQSLRSIANLDIDPGAEMPDWLSIESRSIALVSDNSLDRHTTKFNLSLIVYDTAEHPDTILPLVLTDNLGRTWELQLHVQVPISKAEKSQLFGNFPNPFNPMTTIRYKLNHSGAKPTTLAIFDMLGQRIRTLVNEPQSSGAYEILWDARDEQGRAVASGIYVYSLKSGSFKQTRSMTLIQ